MTTHNLTPQKPVWKVSLISLTGTKISSTKLLYMNNQKVRQECNMKIINALEEFDQDRISTVSNLKDYST